MFRLTRLLFASALSTLTAWASATTPVPVGEPAAWTAHDLIVRFEHLPKIYSCDDLWYKFRDVLRTIGARPDLSILAYQCGQRLGSMAYSPQVRLHFYIPQALGPAQAQWADLNAEPRTVRLEPGHPTSITVSDCELLRQMKDQLLAALPDRVPKFNLACESPATRWPFSVSVEVLTPVAGQGRVAVRQPPSDNPGT
jgi:hypothetical protein